MNAEQQNYCGWDPFDGLNSELFKNSLFDNWPYARLFWVQLFKRSPINFRKIVRINKEINPMALALFLLGLCKIHSIYPNEKYDPKIGFLATKIIESVSPGYSGSAWGYNFDWQARGGLYFPKGTPNIIVTTFCVAALIDAYLITGNEKYLDTALSSSNFVIKDLSRTSKPNGFLFSYSPLKGNSSVYNASLMGSKLLSYCYNFTNKSEYYELASESVSACIDAQSDDGSWIYGDLPFQNWIDSFHTGYVLECLYDYQELCKNYNYQEQIQKGLNYYVKNFFLADGTPKYYNNKTYPIDIHSPAQFLVTLSKLKCLNIYREMADKILSWTLKNMQDNNGNFYFRKGKMLTNKIPYLRWSQASMFLGMSHYFASTMGTSDKLEEGIYNNNAS